MYRGSTVRRYGRSMVHTYGCTNLQIRTFNFFATGVLTYMYGRSTFPFLSDIPYCHCHSGKTSETTLAKGLTDGTCQFYWMF